MSKLVKAVPDLPQVEIWGIDGKLETYEEHVAAWHHLSGLQDDLNWTRGAIVASLVVRHGEGTLAKFAKDIGRSEQAAQKYRQVRLQNPNRLGFPGLKWTHFEAVAALPEPGRIEALTLATKGNGDGKPWSVSELRRHVRWVKRQSDEPLPEGKFRVIYADPPWMYGRDQHTGAEQETVLGTHYPSMTVDEICALDIPSLAADESVLFLWATSPLLPRAFEVIEAWGFDYKASMVWDKVLHNVGHYVSVRHELLLIATKGSCLPEVPELVDSVVSIERTEHSRKPEEFRKVIERLYPTGPHLELFARAKVDGWEVYGNDPRVAVG